MGLKPIQVLIFLVMDLNKILPLLQIRQKLLTQKVFASVHFLKKKQKNH